jgi:hypothetical protein
VKDIFRCHVCKNMWEMQLVPIVDHPKDLEGWQWPLYKCPHCGSLYFDWLTYGHPR